MEIFAPTIFSCYLRPPPSFQTGAPLPHLNGRAELAPQLHDLRQLAPQRGYQIVSVFFDVINGMKARRPWLDALMADARRGHFDVVPASSCDRIACSIRHTLAVLDDLKRLEI